MACHATIERRPHTSMILGWDFMVDTQLNVRLLECNKGPDLSASTSVTKRLRESMLAYLASMFDD